MAQMTYTFARHETKFLITARQRQRLIGLLSDHIRPDEWGRSTVMSLYCDTPSGTMIRHSLEHPVYKEKIRIRSYGVAGEGQPVFLELKQKVKGVTYKRRATMPLDRALAFVAGHGVPETQIEREIAATVSRYSSCGGVAPAMMISCERQAFFAVDDPSVRLTFDEGIRWSDERLSMTEATDGNTRVLDDDLVLLEVKCGAAMPLWLTRAIASIGLRSTGFSKYGVAWKQRLVASGMTSATDGLAPAIAWARRLDAEVTHAPARRRQITDAPPSQAVTRPQRAPVSHIRLGGMATKAMGARVA